MSLFFYFFIFFLARSGQVFLIKVILCVTVFLVLSYSTWPPLRVCQWPPRALPVLQAFRYGSTEMAHNLYFIRPWYNWWQWGKVMPLGALVLSPSGFQDKILQQQPSSQNVDWTRWGRWGSEYGVNVLRGVEMQSVLERSNYSACIYFEKHAGAIIYSAQRHILERILKRDNSHGS